MPKGIKGFQKGHKHSEKTKKKIGLANSRKILFNCDYCGQVSSDKPSSYNRKNRHFCSAKCYSLFRKEFMPVWEQNRYGTGYPKYLVDLRKRARGKLNHAITDKKIIRLSCEVCGMKAEAHHNNYDKPLEVKWLCFKHHREYHKENPELLEEQDGK